MLFKIKFIFIFVHPVICFQTQSNAITRFLGSCTSSILSMFDNDFNNSTELELALVKNDPTYMKYFKLTEISQLLNDKNFNNNYKTIIYIYGYMDIPQFPLTQYLIQGYKRASGYNVIIYDTKTQEMGLYMRTVKRAPDMGKRLGTALAQLYSAGYDITKLELVGHSLGAQIAGFAGKTFFNLTKQKLPTIFALDAAGPCFESADKDSKITDEDAEMIVAIHTNAKYSGITKPIGTIDIYVNGGILQPGNGPFISHVKVLTFWISALQNPKKFIAYKCKNLSSALAEDCQSNETVLMGPDIDRKAKGIYYIKILNSDL